MNKIISICRNYLWDGHEEYHRVPLVAWDKVCQEKKQGGLGLIHCKTWNCAALGKYVWWIEAKKDHLWVKWVNHVYIKGQEWLSYEPPVWSSWTWRKICKVKDMLLTGFKGRWNNDSKEYTIKDGYRFLSGDGLQVSWHHWTWNRFNIPKVSFIVWLAHQDRLLTLVRIQRYVPCATIKCYFCCMEDEDCSHLFFQCEYCRRCLAGLSTWLTVAISPTHWRELKRVRRLSGFQKNVCSAAVNGLLYWIWFQRNICRLEGGMLRPALLVQQVRDSVLMRFATLDLKVLKTEDRLWLERIRA